MGNKQYKEEKKYCTKELDEAEKTLNELRATVIESIGKE